MEHDLFISYSSKDKAIADAICHTFEENKLRCWIAPRDCQPGSYAKSITQAIKSSKLLVLVYSNSINYSEHVKRELDLAINYAKTIVPFRIEEVSPSPAINYYLSSVHYFNAITLPLESHILEITKIVKRYLEIDNRTQKDLNDLIKKTSVSKEKVYVIDNYDHVMHTEVQKSQYFRMLAPAATKGSVYHIDIKEGKVCKIESVIRDIRESIIKNDGWIYLSGGSGLSKTTSAKILAYKLKGEGFSIIFTKKVKEIKNFMNSSLKIKSKTLLIIEDLHRISYGKINEKLLLLNSITNKPNVSVLCISRIPLEKLKRFYIRNVREAHEIAEKFNEIKMEDYKREIENAKKELVKKIFQEFFPLNHIEESKIDHFLNEYGADFISLGFSLLPIINKEINDINQFNDYLIFEGIYQFLKNEFEEIIENYHIDGRILLGVFIGACYEALYDKIVTVNYFDQNEIYEGDLWIALDALTNQGLLTRSREWITKKNNKVRIDQFGLNHAKIAEFYIQVLKSGIHLNEKHYKWNEMAILSQFKANLPINFDLKEFFTSFNKLRIIDLSNSGINEIPKNVNNLRNLENLILTNNNLRFLPDSICELKNLNYLDLSLNKMLELPEAISNLKSLKNLNLYDNKLKKLPNSFGGLESLEKLSIEFNELTELPESFSNLKCLKKVSLGGNHLTFLPDSIGNLNSLLVLSLYDNKIKNLPDSIENLNSLETLNLIQNNIEELPKTIGQLRNLRNLYISDNKLKQIPESIISLELLEKLEVDNNNLMELPQNVGDLKNITHLHLENNNLKELPSSICDLLKLEKLSLSRNKLVSLPKSIGNLKSLIKITLGENNLTELPYSFADLENLKEIFCNNNKIVALNEKIGNLKELINLSLHGNLLEYLPESICNFKLLEKLDLDANKLKILPKSIGGLKSLRILYLENNNLEHLPGSFCDLKLIRLRLSENQLEDLPNDFGNLKFLRFLNLSYNKLKKLPESFENLEALQELYLDNNQISKISFPINKLKYLEVLNLYNNDLITFPEELCSLPQIVSLNLAKNKISEIPKSIKDLISLKSLVLSDNKLKTIPKSINKLKNLRELLLNNNELRKLPFKINEIDYIDDLHIENNKL
ncbi:MAG: leucine-rich repeat domain-containing protein [Candidatus Hodarchaeota archaeon]